MEIFCSPGIKDSENPHKVIKLSTRYTHNPVHDPIKVRSWDYLIGGWRMELLYTSAFPECSSAFLPFAFAPMNEQLQRYSTNPISSALNYNFETKYRKIKHYLGDFQERVLFGVAHPSFQQGWVFHYWQVKHIYMWDLWLKLLKVGVIRSRVMSRKWVAARGDQVKLGRRLNNNIPIRRQTEAGKTRWEASYQTNLRDHQWVLWGEGLGSS